MKSVHKSLKGLKRDGVLLLLFDLGILAFAVTRNTGILFQSTELHYIAAEFVAAVLLNAWWVCDSKIWITNKTVRANLWLYIMVECALLLAICILTFLGKMTIASVIVYILAVYCMAGIGLLMFL